METYKKKTTYDKILEIVAIAALLGSFCPLLFYNTIATDAVFPIHYNIDGEVDGWGGRSNLWGIPSIALLLYIGFSIVQRYPKIYNYPCLVTEQNRDYLYRMGVQLMRHIKVCVIIIFAYASNDMYIGAINKSSKPMPIVYAIVMAGMFVPVIIYVIKMIRYKPK